MAFRKASRRLSSSIDALDHERLSALFAARPVGAVPIASVPLRRRSAVLGEVSTVRVVPRQGSPWLEVTLRDGTGVLVATFTGRRQDSGVTPGRALLVEGVAHDDHGRPLMLNPAYTLLSAPGTRSP